MSKDNIYELIELYSITKDEIENELNLPIGFLQVITKNNLEEFTGIALDSLALAVSSIVEKREQQYKAPSTQETPPTAKGMLLHYDLHPLFKALNNEQCGELIKALFDYAINGILPGSSDSLVNLGFEMIKPKIDKHEQKKRRAVGNAKKAKI